VKVLGKETARSFKYLICTSVRPLVVSWLPLAVLNYIAHSPFLIYIFLNILGQFPEEDITTPFVICLVCSRGVQNKKCTCMHTHAIKEKSHNCWLQARKQTHTAVTQARVLLSPAFHTHAYTHMQLAHTHTHTRTHMRVMLFMAAYAKSSHRSRSVTP
jgi:hypothetical protein